MRDGMKFKAYYDKYNDRKVLACVNCYEKKDTLKEIGFQWNPLTREWFKNYTTLHEMTAMFVDALIACDCDYSVYEDSWSESESNNMNKIMEPEAYDAESLKKLLDKYGEDETEE